MFPPAETPPPPAAEMNVYWSDEQIILLLSEYTPKSRLPNNVLPDLSPYQYPPSNLPEGFWYLVPSDEKKESIHGFWKATVGEACEVYSNSTIIGWRATLQYYKGQSPDEQITDWLMQEYWITKKELCDTDKPKELSLLCRVFLCSDNCSKAEKDPKEIITSPVATVGRITVTKSGQESGSDSKAKREACQVVESQPVADNKTNFPPPPQAFSELDCFSIGDYLELDDLAESLSSSSQNSSCLSKLSDDAFDASAFLRDIEEEERKMQLQQSSSRYDFRSVGLDNVVLQPAATSGSVLTGSVRTEGTLHNGSTDERVAGNTAKRDSPAESTTEATSYARANGEKKGGGRMKKLKMYFCFKPF